MRRVFPLRPSENCLLVTYDVEELHGTESKSREQGAAESATRLTRRSESSNCDMQVSSDGLPDRERVTAKRASRGKPPTAAGSGYPVFAGEASFRYPSSRPDDRFSDKGRKELGSVSFDRHRFATSSSSSKSISQRVVGKDISSSVPKNHASFDTSRSGYLQVPETAALSSANGELQKSSYSVSDVHLVVPRRRLHSLSVATSERSYCDSSDLSSCFTKTTESSSSRSVASESSHSKKGSISRKPSSPFRCLSARMVAEKLVKALGKEKPHFQQSRTNSPRFGETPKKDPSKQRRESSFAATSVNVLFEPSPSVIRYHPSRAHETSGSTDLPNELSRCEVKTYNKAKDSPMLSTATTFEKEANSDVFAGLDTRSSELAAAVDNETNNSSAKVTFDYCLSLVDSSGELDTQNLDAFRHEIFTLRREKRHLAAELAAERKTRISEQQVAADTLRSMKVEMECQVTAIEKDKTIVQETLERELERREEEWAAKLEKIKKEEKRLRDEVIEMAEERVELRKALSAFKLKEASWRAHAKESGFSLHALNHRDQGSDAEAAELKGNFADKWDKLKTKDDELDVLAQGKKFLEIENKNLQKEILRLRRVYNHREMTIDGLWQELNKTIDGTSECKDESTRRLQRELLRLVEVEHALRNEMDAMKVEMANLKQNRSLTCDGTPMDLVQHNRELQRQMKGLQSHAVILQGENRQLFIDLRAALREKRDAEATLRSFQLSKEGIDNLKGSSTALNKDDEKANVWRSEALNGSVYQLKEDLNTGKILRKVSCEDLQSSEAELEQLDGEITVLIHTRDFLQTEVDELCEKLVVANQRIRELEHQLHDKQQEIEVLQADLQEHAKEVNELRKELPSVKKQRDEFRKEAEDMTREALRSTLELTDLKRLAEKLDEELMLKEGQISILRGACGDVNC